jgi:hypothetical protein
MMGTLNYKTFSAQVEFDWFDLSYVGHVVNAHHAIGFCGTSSAMAHVTEAPS